MQPIALTGCLKIPDISDAENRGPYEYNAFWLTSNRVLQEVSSISVLFLSRQLTVVSYCHPHISSSRSRRVAVLASCGSKHHACPGSPCQYLAGPLCDQSSCTVIHCIRKPLCCIVIFRKRTSCPRFVTSIWCLKTSGTSSFSRQRYRTKRTQLPRHSVHPMSMRALRMFRSTRHKRCAHWPQSTYDKLTC